MYLRSRRYRFLSPDRLEERTLLAGNVTAALSGNLLTITGDGKSNDITVEQTDATHIRITGNIDVGAFPGKQTTVQAGGLTANVQTIQVPVVFGLKINMGAGDDSVRIGTGNSVDLDSLNADLGKGQDSLQIRKTTVTGGANVSLKLGGGENDNDTLVIISSQFGNAAVTADLGGGDNYLEAYLDVPGQDNSFKSLTVNSGGQDDVIKLTSTAAIFGNMTINAGSGDDAVTLTDVTVGGNLTIASGAGNDAITVDGATINGGLWKLDAGDGNDDVELKGANGTGTFTALLGAGADHLNCATSVVVLATTGTTTLDAGSGNDWLFFSGTVGNALQLKGGAGQNDLALAGQVTGGALTVDGGSDRDYIHLDNLAVSNATAGHVTVNLAGGTNFAWFNNVTAAGDVKVNGGSGDDGFDAMLLAAGSLAVSMGGGNDYVGLNKAAKTLAGGVPASAMLNVLIDLAAGDDDLMIRDFWAVTAAIKAGEGANFADLDHAIAATLNFTGGGGVETVNIRSSNYTSLTANFGNGANVVGLNAVNVAGTMNATFGGGDDTLNVGGSAFGVLTGNFGPGFDLFNDLGGNTIGTFSMINFENP